RRRRAALRRGRAVSRGIRHPVGAPPGPGEAVEIAEGVLWGRLPLPMALDHVNVYAFDDGDAWTVVDSGLNWRGCREGWERLLAGPLSGRPVARLVVTHHHPDHMGLAADFIARGAALLTTRTAWLYARMLQLDHEERPSAEAVAFRRRAGYDPARLAAYAETEPFNFSRTVARLPLGFERIGAVVAEALERVPAGAPGDLESLMAVDRSTRQRVQDRLRQAN
ncbi:MAG: MBL fold metallo-hydrolase, partial [Halothiobacillaceae bacterium]